jgi:hypothetical protein
MTSPLTIAETPVSTPSIEYDHRHVAMDMDVKPEATIGQLLASSLRKVTTASFKGMAYGVGAAQHRLHRGLVTFNQQSESTRPAHPTSPAPPPPIIPTTLYPSISPSHHRSSPTVTFQPAPNIVQVQPRDNGIYYHTTSAPTAFDQSQPAQPAPPLTSTTTSTLPSNNGFYSPTGATNIPPDNTPHAHCAHGPNSTSGFTWRTRPTTQHADMPSRHPSAPTYDQREHSSTQPTRGATYGTPTYNGLNPYLAQGTHPPRNMTPNYTMLGTTYMGLDNFLALLQRDIHISHFTKQSNIPPCLPNEPIGMWYRRFVLHGTSYGFGQLFGTPPTGHSHFAFYKTVKHSTMSPQRTHRHVVSTIRFAWRILRYLHRPVRSSCPGISTWILV